ncbi:hypothetical protein BU24DRAFT_68962 [Aaosphaeria arxii CBS 175.79]|uniref:Uncharacterized protein n=1 Tax=Aaosphaeria arxii CBS 175.79 TaxID=1450172 RepID=A0A6A5XB50_9PLEO|nr:uncharacterized protein BU24DRAFT_68962 [Aaosphaeria arxii CBS 175.79]KAF2009994.1 hypothetical protein BU24DRAFT_68962 [Aaosphaeria arxii CBS 175.79]
MSFCNTCGEMFEGPGSYCLYHDPYSTKHSFGYNKLDFDGFPSIKYRTGQGSHGHNHHRHHQQQHHLHHPHTHHTSHKLKDYDTYDVLGRYDNSLDLVAPSDSALIQYNDQTALQPFNNYNYNYQTSNSQSHPILAAAASTFTRLTANYSINHMSFSMAPNGTKSVNVSANKDREQCSTCKKWFPDHEKLRNHMWELPSGCEVHNMCFTRDEESFHGTRCRHDRCFVKGCGSVYRKEGGWKTGVVENHVREFHL